MSNLPLTSVDALQPLVSLSALTSTKLAHSIHTQFYVLTSGYYYYETGPHMQ